MGLSSGPNSATLGLVFAYDTGDTVNSYIGEPTTNQFTNSNFTNGTTGWTFGSWDGGRYLYSVENVLGPFGAIVPALKITRTSSDTSYAHFHQYNSGKYSNGNTYTLSAYVKGAGTLGQYNQGGFTPLNYNPGQFVTLNSTWQRVDYTLSSQTDSNYPYWAAENITQNVPMYFVFAQSELKTHPTQYTPSSRSVTQGLLPLTGSSINLTDVSFNSSAQMVFDGTNDYINTDFTSGYEGTVELIIKCSDYDGDTPFSLDSDNYSSGPNIYFTSNQICWNTGDGNGNPFSNASYPNSNYHHLVITNQSSGAALYIDGVLIGTAAGRSMVTTGSNKLWIGRFHGGGYYFNGELPVLRLYSRPLNASEVKENYKGYKTRFNLA